MTMIRLSYGKLLEEGSCSVPLWPVPLQFFFVGLWRTPLDFQNGRRQRSWMPLCNRPEKKRLTLWNQRTLQCKSAKKGLTQRELHSSPSFNFMNFKLYLLWRSFGVEIPQVSIRCSTSCGNKGCLAKEVFSPWWALKYLFITPLRLGKAFLGDCREFAKCCGRE